MPFTKDTVEEKTMIKIDSSLTIYDAPALYEEFLNCFENGGDVTIDLGEVNECDVAGIQLLCAVRKSALGRQQPFRVLGVSNAIMESLDRLGLNKDEII